jgi:D-3-phosphoglycerate dehydrogenase / 2-oxoglutarate reductase
MSTANSDGSHSSASPQSLAGHVVAIDAARYNRRAMDAERAAWEAQGLTLEIAAASTEDEIIAAGQNADVITYMGLYTPFTRRVLENLPRCRMIMRYGIGFETVDLDAATEQGIVICNAAEFCVPEVADHTVALILNLARRIAYLDRNVRAGNWSEVMAATGQVRRLSTQTVGLVGFGRIARQVAINLRPMVGQILACDPYVAPQSGAEMGVEIVEMDDLLHRSDYVSVHTPLMPTTRHLIGPAQLAQMQPTAYLVNTSRGPVVDESALIEALQNKQIAGAALDVFEAEPLALDSPLRTLENVTLTPHTASHSAEAGQDVLRTVIQSVLDFTAGRRPPHVVNPAVEAQITWSAG